MTSTKSQILGQLEALRLLVEQLPDEATTDDRRPTTAKPVLQPVTDNQAAAYGVTVVPVTPVRAAFWRAVEVRHLSPSENKGRRGVYVDVIGPDGKRVRNSTLMLCYSWQGRGATEAAPPKPFDKENDTGHGMIDIWKGQVLSVWVGGDGLASDVVQGMHSNHPDEPGPNGETWNSVGHHSFYIKFQVVGMGN